MSTKDAALEVIRNMPDDATAEDMAYELYVRAKIDEALRQSEAGEGISHDEFKKRNTKWLA
ncbi:MAG: hypothetical protein ACRC7O_08470 [Fimbriiglobus sp.]